MAPSFDGKSRLPSKSQWIYSGSMSKKVASIKGKDLFSRFAVLTESHLFFTKHGDQNVPIVSSESSKMASDDALRAAFTLCDKNHDGSFSQPAEHKSRKNDLL